MALVLWLGPWLYERDLPCHTAASARGQEICRSLSEHLEFTCCGHAIISPGYRVTRSGLARTWCAVKPTPQDAAVLAELSRSHDWRLESGAGRLLEMLTGRSRYGGVELGQNNVLNPNSSIYILKDGCDAVR